MTRPDRAAPLRVEPFDKYNQQLVANVRPHNWVNPRPRERYHLAVVGAGTAGLVTASIAAGLGARVALIERHLMGGDCLNVGCVPSKAVLGAARAWQAAAEADKLFGGPRVVGTGNFAQVMERMRGSGPGSAGSTVPRGSVSSASTYYLGKVGSSARRARGERPDAGRFRRAVIATGGRAAVPPVPGLDGAGYLTNETIFSLTELPESLLVLGGGPVGSELAQAFARFGSRVTVVTRHSQILRREDADGARIVERAMEREGVRFLHRSTPVRAELRERSSSTIGRAGRAGGAGGRGSDPGAVGRVPNVEDLGLEAAGVRADRRGVVVDDLLRTSNRRILCGRRHLLAVQVHSRGRRTGPDRHRERPLLRDSAEVVRAD